MSSHSTASTVLYLTHNFPRYPGDFAGAFVARLAELVVQRGVRAVVVVPHAPGVPEQESVNGVDVRRFRYAPDRDEVIAYRGEMGKIGLRGAQSVWAYNRFLRAFTAAARAAVTEYRPDVIHAHWWIPGGVVARRLSTSPRYVLTMHGTDIRLLAKLIWIRPLARRVFRRAEQLTVVSSSLAAIVSSVVPEAASKLTVLPMPPNDDAFTAAEQKSPGDGAPLILCVTRFTEQKRNALLLRAARRLLDDGSQFRLKLIGEGPLGEQLKSLASDLDLQSHLEFSPPVAQADLATEYGRADIVVLPSVDEGLGMVLIEAQMCGTAVVGAASGGILDIIKDGATGVLATPDSVDSLTEALRSLLENPDRRIELAAAAQASARSRFSSGAITSRFMSLYGLDSGVEDSTNMNVPT